MRIIPAPRGRTAAQALTAVAIAAAALGLSGCLTARVKPTPSAAVLEAREHREKPAPVACPAIDAPISVGFGFGEATLSDLATPSVAEAAQLLACHPQASALVVGQADAHGTPDEQKALAEGRAEAVVAALRARGVAPARLATQTQGTPPAAEVGRVVVLAEGRRW